MPGTRLHVELRGKEYQATPCDSDSHMALLNELDHHLDTGQITSNEAVHRLTTALQDDPLWLDGLLEQATLHDEMLNDEHRKANRKCAFEIATKALPEKFTGPLPWHHVPNRPILRAISAWTVENALRGEHKVVTRLARQMLKWNPTDNQAMRYLLGPAQLRAGQTDAAKTTLTKTAAQNPAMRYELGLLLFETGEFVDAVTTMRRALIENPYIAENLLTEDTAWPMPLWQGSDEADYDGAYDYVNFWGRRWMSNTKAMHLLRWVQTHPRLMAERGQALEPVEELLHEKSVARRLQLVELRISRLAAINDELSREVINTQNGDDLPWESMQKKRSENAMRIGRIPEPRTR